MNRWAQGIIFGGIITAVVAIIWRLVPQNKLNYKKRLFKRIVNYFANMFINVLGKLGVFQLFGKSKVLKNMLLYR